MNRVFPGRTLFVTAYILITIGFLTIHFTRVESFSTVLNGIVVKGRSSVGTSLSAPQIRRLKVNVNGLELSLRKSDKAILITDDGIRHYLDITGWERDIDSVRILFSEGAGLTIRSNPHDSSVLLIPEIPTTVPPVRSLELPLKPEKNVIISAVQGHPGTLSISAPDMEYVASLPSDSSWDSKLFRLNLVVLDKADPILEITDDHHGGGLDAAEWFNQGNLPTLAVYQGTVKDWLSETRNGWKTGIEIKGTAEWSDVLAAAVLADAVMQGQLPSKLASIVSLADSYSGKIGWLPSPFLGNIINQSRVHRQEIGREARNIISALKNKSPDFNLERPLTALLDSGFSSEASLMLSSTRQAPLSEATNSGIISRLLILQEAAELSIDDPVGDPALRKSYFDNFIIPNIFWVKDGLWLIEEDGSINLSHSIAAGVLLIIEAQMNNDNLYQSVGRQLIISALNYSADNGYIPGKLLFETDGEVTSEGSIPPEKLYSSIANAPAYPRHVSLAQELGSGSWAITSAERFSLRSTPRETAISMDFPPGSIHHLAIQGIKSFNVLYMNGIRWNGDPNFQRYYAGWYYDQASETLYVKIRHKEKTETIRILYYEPEETAVKE